MPPFLAPSSATSNGLKRKSEATEDYSRKRPANDTTSSGGERYWMVQWRLPQARKHKTWEGDGVLVVNSSRATLMDQDGRVIGSGKIGLQTLEEGAQLSVGGKELELDRALSRHEYLSGECFGRSTTGTSNPSTSSNTFTKKFTPLRPLTINPGTTVRQPSTPSVTSKVTSKDDDLGHAPESYWTANWRKPQGKKHKTWDGDAFVVFKRGKITLISEQGKILGSKPYEGARLMSGFKNFIAGREIELDAQVPRSSLPALTGVVDEPENEIDPDAFQLSQSTPARRANSPIIVQDASSPVRNSPSATKKFVAPAAFYNAPATKPKPKGPLHDPAGEGAIVMKSPDAEHKRKYNKKGYPVVPVVLDPLLGRRLRPHQVEGVKFMYECVMGLRKHEGQGCILADEMGMGKTLQTITLIWTLLKQNPYAGGGPSVGKVLIVCPVSLVNNWKSEFNKWLGRDRLGIMAGDKDKSILKQFINSKRDQVMIIGYERLRSIIADLAYCNPPIGLIIADEGHRLKGAGNKTSTMFEALRTKRRIILSGTPIQNDLGEFHAMADFCNPGLLDDYNTFRRVYETPILRSRTPGCSDKDAQLGKARAAQLQEVARSFVLRRDATILKSYLPPKHEYVVFVTPTTLQLSIFNKLLNPDKLDNIIHDSTAESLALINMLTKVSNSPILLQAVADKNRGDAGSKKAKARAVEEAVKLLPERAQVDDVSLSGKLAALATLLRAIRKDTDEKCVLVSHYTSALNILEAFCKKKSYSYLRLDGSTPTAKRQEYVNEFNRSSQNRCFIFLLSSKAGGVGLNLIGASRLCLVDSDWNPSHDLQSMARIHRDGQKREVHIYRFLTAGTIDEKIYQRQVTKLGLSSTLIGDGKGQSKSDSFTPKELRDIFTVHPNTACHTHDLLDCPCDRENVHTKSGPADSGSDGSDSEEERPAKFISASQVNPGKADKGYLKKQKAALAALGQWRHINCLKPGAKALIKDDLLHHLLHMPERNTASLSSEARPRASTLLDAVDLDNVLAMSVDDADNLRDVPGGTLSFLFQKDTSITTQEEEERGIDDEVAEEDGQGENVVDSGEESDISMPETISK
ncbi:unnamed protein product [Peniophora sp. CBMAI 1063]|nr:unnamed protein product [Peniophora sp. CBMAI 1063]